MNWGQRGPAFCKFSKKELRVNSTHKCGGKLAVFQEIAVSFDVSYFTISAVLELWLMAS